MKKKRRGSLAVEATISFSVFISFMFLLLNIVKLILFMIILNNAAVETAKTIATVGYPLTFLNQHQDTIEKKEDYLKNEKLSDMTGSAVQAAAFSNLLGGNPDEMIKSGALHYLENFLMGSAVKIIKGEIYALKSDAVKGIAGWFIENSLQNTGIAFNPERLNLRMVKIPVTKMEYVTVYSDPVPLSDKGTLQATPASAYDGDDGDFNGEDVVICLEYPVRIILPFLDQVNVTLRATAVEHAWLNSTCSGPKRTEGIDLTNLLFGKDTMVAVATGGYGKCYHKPGCSRLWEKSSTVPLEPAAEKAGIRGTSVQISRSTAIKEGYTPCKVCKPDDENK